MRNLFEDIISLSYHFWRRSERVPGQRYLGCRDGFGRTFEPVSPIGISLETGPEIPMTSLISGSCSTKEYDAMSVDW